MCMCACSESVMVYVAETTQGNKKSDLVAQSSYLATYASVCRVMLTALKSRLETVKQSKIK